MSLEAPTGAFEAGNAGLLEDGLAHGDQLANKRQAPRRVHGTINSFGDLHAFVFHQGAER